MWKFISFYRKIVTLNLAVILLVGGFLSQPESISAEEGKVKVRTEDLTLPTYKLPPDEPLPIFQDSYLPGFRRFRDARSIYPYTLQDQFNYTSEEVTYAAVSLENEYIKVIILPELRGRLQGAIDKRNGWDFLYYNHVIKPGDIGVRAAWLSGGIEWNHPRGHGYTQFSEISYKIVDSPEGGKSVVVSEVEPVRQQKWSTVITLNPGRLYVKQTGKFYSQKSYPVQLVSSTNGAMHATDGMEMIYGKGTYITGHGKHRYNKWSTWNGIDHAWYQEQRSSLSIFAADPVHDFFGCYSHDKEAGTVIVADHRKAPGKKYWTWGSGSQGTRWNTLLSDNDGPYIELQVGAFWDNLGYGYAWLDPMEVKQFTAYWYPVMGTNGFVKANRDIVLNVQPHEKDHTVRVAAQATREMDDVAVHISAFRQELHQERVDLRLSGPYTEDFAIPQEVNLNNLFISITGSEGDTLIQYNTGPSHRRPPELPDEMDELDLTADQLYQKAKSIYQDPFSSRAEAYYQEMLNRDPEESRAHRELGKLYLFRGKYGKAGEHLEQALDRDPLNTGYRANFYLGRVSQILGDLEQAEEHYGFASRYSDMQVPALYYLGVTSIKSADYQKAVAFFNEAIDAGGQHPRLWSRKAVALRALGKYTEARAAIREALNQDRIHYLAHTEQLFSARDGGSSTEQITAEIHGLFDRSNSAFKQDSSFVGSQPYLYSAVQYIELNAWQKAVEILELAVNHYEKTGRVYPMLEYYLGYCYQVTGNPNQAEDIYQRAATRNHDFVFPYRPLSIEVLGDVASVTPENGRAQVALGNVLYYLRRSDEAMKVWERAAAADPDLMLPYRNRAIGAWAQHEDTTRTIRLLEQAVEREKNTPRLFAELDHMYDAIGATEKRLELKERYGDMMKKRDDQVLSWAVLHIRLGEYEKAVKLMDETKFAARENDTKVIGAHTEAHLGYGEILLENGQADEALRQIEKAWKAPANLSAAPRDDRIMARGRYLLGRAHAAMGDTAAAMNEMKKIISTRMHPGTEAVYYHALALRELGQRAEATSMLYDLITQAETELREGADEPATLYFAKSRAYEALGVEKKSGKLMKKARAMDQDVVLNARIEAARPVGEDYY